LEDRLKKGLLGTTFQAWQENLEAGDPRPDVYIVPCTLSYQLVLEAPTLINDHLAEAGRGRYIIEDDEFSKPAVVASFLSRVLNLDASTVVRFGAPLDLFGAPVPRSLNDRKAASERRKRYVCSRSGAVEWDEQRDNLYTSQLASRIVEAYKVTTTVLTTHLACHVAWNMLAEQQGTTDPFRLVRTDVAGRHLLRSAYLKRLERALDAVKRGAQQGLWHHDLPATALAVLEIALDRFGRFHKSKALADHGGDLIIEDPRLCLYYQNRLSSIDLSAFMPQES